MPSISSVTLKDSLPLLALNTENEGQEPLETKSKPWPTTNKETVASVLQPPSSEFCQQLE